MGERSAAIDAVRVVGMVAVVAGHVWINPETRQWLYTWHLPLFFILTGYLWSGRRGIKGEAGVRARTLLVPYACWFAIIAAITRGFQLVQGTFNPRVAAGQVWGGPLQSEPFWAFWFATALFVATVLYVPVSRLALPWQWCVALVLLIVTAYVPGTQLAFLPLAIGQGLGAFVFVVAGQTLRRAQARMNRDGVVGPAMLASGVALVLLFPDSFVDVKSLYFGVPIVGILTAVLIGGGLIVTACAYLTRMPRRLSVTVVWLSMSSLVVMFVHVPIASALDALGNGSVTGFLITIVATWALGLVLVAFPAAWFLTGARGAAPRANDTPSVDSAAIRPERRS
jgi:acyltransferase